MERVLHRAGERGGGDYGWLKTKYSFSFGSWFDPRRMGYGALRVINDDWIAPLGKFEMHAHKDFEIVTIPLSGAVTHTDSLGNTGVVQAGEVQVMSAGTGVTHSEENASSTEPLTLFQIWVAPREKDLSPRYAQRAFDPAAAQHAWQTLVSGDGHDGSLQIYQDAVIARASLIAGSELSYTPRHEGSGLYVLVVSGDLLVEGVRLLARDALGLSGVSLLTLSAQAASEVLLFEVPL
jgi:redox-sensitive bicupin YhaK (pirin superfamily)